MRRDKGEISQRTSLHVGEGLESGAETEWLETGAPAGRPQVIGEMAECVGTGSEELPGPVELLF